MSGPRHNDRSAPSTCLPAPVDLLVDEVLDRRTIALVAPADNIEEPEALQRTDGSSVDSVAGAALYTSTRILDAETRRVAAAGRRDGSALDDTTVDLVVAGDGGERHRPGCAASGTGPPDVHLQGTCPAGDRPLPVPGRRPPCAPSPWLGPKTAGRCSASPHPRPQLPSSPSKPASAPTPSPNSPGRCSMATFPTGRPRSTRRPW
jgi:hypothetical protein